jgi:hypothetical protein
MPPGDSTPGAPDAPTAANLQAFRRAATGLLVFGSLALLVALGLMGIGAWACTAPPSGSGEWKGVSEVIGILFIAAGGAVLIPSIFMLIMQRFVRRASRTAAGLCIVTEIVFALAPAALIAGRALISSPNAEEIALGLLGLCLWVGPHWWLVITLRKARGRGLQMPPA